MRSAEYAQRRNLVSAGSGDAAGEAPASNSSPLRRSIAISAAISSAVNKNFGRASTPAYSSSISAEKQGCTKP